MRLPFFCLLVLLNLMGCVYYGDIHGHSKPVTLSDLSTEHHSITLTDKKSSSIYWWTRFNDPILNQLIAAALENSPTMALAENRVRRAEHLAERAGAPLWPSIDLDSYLQRQRFSVFGLAPPPFNGKIYNIGDIGLNFNYEFDFWGKHRQTLATKISEKNAAEAELAESRLVISAAIAHSYFQLIGSILEKEIAQKSFQERQEISDIVVERAKRGIESDIPVKTALADAEAAQLSIEKYKQNEWLARNQLAILLGNNPLTTKIPVSSFPCCHYPLTLTSSLPLNITSLTANVLANRPDIYAMRERAEAAAHQINVAKAGFFPNIHLSALLSYQSIELNHLFENQSQNNAITGAIDLPIFDAGARRANLGVKYAEYDMAINDYNLTILTALREVADEQASLMTLHSQIITQDKALKATSHNYTLFNSRYHHGIIDYVQVLEIKELLLEQQALQIQLQTQHLQANIGMIKALGGTIISIKG